MPSQITLPALGENIDSGDVLSILVSEGDTVTKDQDLLEVETDKATMPVPSPSAGRIVKILVSEGDTVNVGAPIFEIEASAAGAAVEEAKQAPPAEPKPEPKPAPAPQPAARQPAPQPDPIHVAAAPAPTPPASEPAATITAPVADVPGDGYSAAAAGPSVRRLARELGVELRRVRPSGEGGRITESDVRAFVRHEHEQADAAEGSRVTAPGRPSSDGQGATRVEKMSRMRQTIAKNMVVSYTTIPQLTNFDDVDITELEEMRHQSKDDYARRGLKLSQMPFLIKAIASSLRSHPIVNASVNMEASEVIYKEYVNIGVAVDTERGLTVPVLRDAD
ncbi:MAG: 2-oxo acid dehydrogenase subunit E2, partial [Planctomycetales bacterium]|nr:2-oxo acid dehydrogenase subunit E2 [Planctomycetales bacterium]